MEKRKREKNKTNGEHFNSKTHAQFLLDLYNKNEHYRNGEFELISEYICSTCVVSISTKFGVCRVQPVNLLQNSNISIVSAENKTEYFIKMCLDRFGEDGNDDLSEVEYVSATTKVKVKCRITDEYYFITPNAYYGGTRSAKSGLLKLSLFFKLDQDYVFNKINELHPELEIIPNQMYISNNKHLIVKDKYGLTKIQPHYLLNGKKPTIKSAINKSEYFINKAREVHNDKYDYSLVEYKDARTKIKIISEYGVFEQIPDAHLRGQGCPIGPREENKKNPFGWRHAAWKLKAEKSKHFTGYVVYFLECWDDETSEKFYKIGRTFNDIRKRFKGKYNMPYKYNILYTIELDDPKRICELEQEYKNKHKEFKYLPTKKFGGMHECFSKLVYI